MADKIQDAGAQLTGGLWVTPGGGTVKVPIVVRNVTVTARLYRRVTLTSARYHPVTITVRRI